MTLGNPALFHLLWLVPLVVGLFVVWRLRARARALEQLGPLVPAQASRGAQRVHRIRGALVTVGLALVALGLAQPRWGFSWVELSREGVDVIVLLDVSRSMNAQDVEPSRLERARREVLDLADLLRGDRVGMVLFAGGAHPDVPLTLDYDVLRTNVRRNETARLVAQGSDLAAGIELATQLFGERTDADRALIILSDGEDHGQEARNAALAAAEAGIHLYAIGVGTPDGAPIPLPTGGFQKDSSGQTVLTRLDEDLLTDLARIGEGAYVRSSPGIQDMTAIYDKEIRMRLRGGQQDVQREKVWNEIYQWPLAAGLLCFALAPLFRPGPIRLSGAAAALALAVLLPSPARADAQGRVAELAAQQAADPGNLTIAEDLGEALYLAGDYQRSWEVLSGVAERSLDPAQRDRAQTNAGLAAYAGGQLVQAVQDWGEVLQRTPDHPAASQNKAAVEQEIAQRLQQQQQQQQQPQEGDNSDQQPQDGEPQEGEPQEGEQQDGEPQNGEPQNADQQPQEGDNTDQQGEPTDPSQAEAPTEPEDEPGSGDQDTGGEFGEKDFNSGDPSDPSGEDAEPADGEAAGGTGAEPGSGTDAEAAERLLDAVDEGSPRVRPSGRKVGEKGW